MTPKGLSQPWQMIKDVLYGPAGKFRILCGGV